MDLYATVLPFLYAWRSRRCSLTGDARRTEEARQLARMTAKFGVEFLAYRARFALGGARASRALVVAMSGLVLSFVRHAKDANVTLLEEAAVVGSIYVDLIRTAAPEVLSARFASEVEELFDRHYRDVMEALIAPKPPQA